MSGFVYFIRCADFVKIGYSAKPKARLRSLRTAIPFDFEFLGAHPGTKQHEQQLHKIFAPLRHRHEWFLADQSILEIAISGLPPIDVPIPVSNTMGEFLRLNKISQSDFAGRLGTSRRAVSHWVSGARIPRGNAMTRIAKATNGCVTANDFYLEAAE